MMGYEEDIGKFVTLSYKTPDKKQKIARGKFDIDSLGLWVFENLSDPSQTKKVNHKEITIIDYFAEKLEVKK